MKRARKLWSVLRQVAWRGVAVVIIAFFGGYALFGSNGVLAWGEYLQKLESRETDLARLQKERGDLANRVALLDPRHANPDLVDELVRRELGLAHPDEVIIPLN